MGCDAGALGQNATFDARNSNKHEIKGCIFIMYISVTLVYCSLSLYVVLGT